MVQTVASAACVRTAPPVTRPVERARVPVAGRARPVNEVRVAGASAFLTLGPNPHSVFVHC